MQTAWGLKKTARVWLKVKKPRETDLLPKAVNLSRAFAEESIKSKCKCTKIILIHLFKDISRGSLMDTLLMFST